MKLAEEVVGGGTAIDAQPSRDDPGVGGHGLEDVTALVRDRLQRRASEMGGGRAPRQAHDGTPRPHVPVGRAQAHERRHEIDAAGVGNGLRDALAVGGGAQDAEAVAQPLDGRACDEDTALEGVGDPSVESPRDRREQPVARRDGNVAGVEQQEAAGAVRVLGVTGDVAGVPEERRLLVAGDAGDRHAIGQPAESARLAEDTGRWPHRREERPRHAEDPEHLVVPIARAQVETERARGVGDVGRVDPTASQLPQEPGVDRPERELAGLGALAGARYLVEQPPDLRPREIGVQDQAGPLAHEGLEAIGTQPLAERRRPAALPHDGAMDRRARRPVPDDCGLALVGDPDGGDVGRAHTRLGERHGRRLSHRGPDLFRVVLDPARLRIVLGQLSIAARDDSPVGVDDESRRARRSLVERQDDARAHARTGLTGARAGARGRGGR